MKSTETKGTRMMSEADTEAEGLVGTSRGVSRDLVGPMAVRPIHYVHGETR